MAAEGGNFDKFIVQLVRYGSFLFCHPIRRSILGALHKTIHDEIPANRCVILIDWPENLVDFFFRVFSLSFKLFGYFGQYYDFFLFFRRKVF